MTVAMDGNREWNQWLEQCLSPIAGDNPVGEDPRYNDNFSTLKVEVEKRQNVDFALIQSLAINVLTANSKDLRAAGYYTLAASRISGLEGFHKGICLMHGLLEKYGQQCHPQKSKARLAALRWPLQPRVLSFVQANTKNASSDLYSEVQTAFNNLCELVRPEISDFGWPDLRKWLSQNIISKPTAVPDTKTEAHNPAESSSQVSSSPGNTGADIAISSIQSETQLLQMNKQLLRYYRDKKQYGVMAGLARSMKWGDLKLPPNENGKTRIPALRDNSINKVKQAFDNEEWDAAFLAAEDAFLDPGGMFCFELQRLAAVSARKAGYSSAAKIIEDLFQSLLARLPKIRQLSYDNGDPFIAGAVIAWLEQIAPSGGSSQSGDTTSELMVEGRKIKEEKSLGEALRWLRDQSTGPGLMAQKVRLIQAQLCHEAGEPAKAYPLLDQLDQFILDNKVETLLPDFAMSVWRQKWLVMKDLKSQADSELQTAYETDISRLQSLMCATDVSLAIEWL